MKVLLINPPFLKNFSRAQRSPAVTKSGTLYYPIWLSYAAGCLIEKNQEVKLIDAVAEDIDTAGLIAKVKKFKPALTVLDTSTPSIYNDLKIADKIKAVMPESFVVLVGAHVSALPDEALNGSTGADAVARGEYDYTLVELTNRLEEGGDLGGVKGLSWRSQGKIEHNSERETIKNLDCLPFVSSVYKKFLDIKRYFFAASDYPMVQIITGRGCRFNCFFCVYPQVMHGHLYRKRSPQNIVDEFNYISKELPQVREVVIEDDTFSIDKARLSKICDLLIENKNTLKWNANVRVDLEFSLMKKMKAAGCRLVIAGFESANQQILDSIAKGITRAKAEKFFSDAKRAGLLVHAAFMAGNPGETFASLEETFAMAKKNLSDTVQFFPLMVYPGTKAFEWAKEKGFLKTSNYRCWLTRKGLHNSVVGLPGLSAGQIRDWCNRSRRRYYLSFAYLFYKLKQMIIHPGQIRRTVKSFLSFSGHLFTSGKEDD
ncbi:MAG: B12-binding domain-containing radical SAM protein [Candidatus Omnitrophica bacterium]|nr:B12-binding domain-containing radical SAM protein [Candidatus Omnitrophota bacterium]